MDNWEQIEILIEYGVCTEEEASLVTDVTGLDDWTVEAIVYSRTGYHTFEDWYEDEVSE